MFNLHKTSLFSIVNSGTITKYINDFLNRFINFIFFKSVDFDILILKRIWNVIGSSKSLTLGLKSTCVLLFCWGNCRKLLDNQLLDNQLLDSIRQQSTVCATFYFIYWLFLLANYIILHTDWILTAHPCLAIHLIGLDDDFETITNFIIRPNSSELIINHWQLIACYNLVNEIVIFTHVSAYSFAGFTPLRVTN